MVPPGIFNVVPFICKQQSFFFLCTVKNQTTRNNLFASSLWFDGSSGIKDNAAVLTQGCDDFFSAFIRRLRPPYFFFFFNLDIHHT